MDKKIKLGINFFFNNSNNSGIVNYIYNIISALKTLPEIQQPKIIVFHSDDAPIEFIKSINYSDILFVLFKPDSESRIIRGLNKIAKKFTKIDFFLKYTYFNKVDVLYPYFGFVDAIFAPIKHKIYWLVDFNNRAFPTHYPDEGKYMLGFQEELTSTNSHIVLSSNTLLNELKSYYPNYKNRVSILQFACSLPDLTNYNISSLKEKFNINGKYLMSPNQFWEHKNQMTLIEALHILKTKDELKFIVVFTGSMAVNRGKGHMLEKLEKAIEEYGLKQHVKFLGIVDRAEQLVLMKFADSLIQPSLYEGWSTLVEEAKALNQKIVLSDLPVHREQNCVNSYFFDPLNAEGLANCLIEATSSTNKKTIDYKENIKKFGRDMLDVVKYELQ